MVRDPFTCQSRAHAGGAIQLHRDGGDTVETQAETFRLPPPPPVALRTELAHFHCVCIRQVSLSQTANHDGGLTGGAQGATRHLDPRYRQHNRRKCAL